jgi:hypothetical protein
MALDLMARKSVAILLTPPPLPSSSSKSSSEVDILQCGMESSSGFEILPCEICGNYDSIRWTYCCKCEDSGMIYRAYKKIMKRLNSPDYKAGKHKEGETVARKPEAIVEKLKQSRKT